jgi:ribosomal protein L15
VLAGGEIGRAVKVEADAFCGSARAAIEAAGGSAVTTGEE